ncbi:hypothetical protein SNE25_01010 [Mucilaginibacter sabulilitoris]|uniref:Uncharacterized protein n=1 Tax=Mucilaginibacter sabulilitoris TaxID=1173583 RepID=A0ABZ0TPH7_9SPHI|nr:hypothetical protein [Mucilaginibacter sabulilitoris]WPU94103.1 hypothetical protein SNE25_01010 [Mucilaginibacter sabulilitoris]
MTVRTIFLFLGCLYFSILHAHAQAVPADHSRVSAVFVASTPCSPRTKPLPGIPRGAGCELIKWELRLVRDTGKYSSGNYVMDCTYGMPKQGARGFINGGRSLHREGKWTIIKGTATNPAAIVYRLDPGKPQVSVSFLCLNKNLLHLLDNRDQLMIGTGAWSYTLNRMQ